MARSMLSLRLGSGVKALFFKALQAVARLPAGPCGEIASQVPSGKGGLAEPKKLGYEFINQTFGVALVW